MPDHNAAVGPSQGGGLPPNYAVSSLPKRSVPQFETQLAKMFTRWAVGGQSHTDTDRCRRAYVHVHVCIILANKMQILRLTLVNPCYNHYAVSVNMPQSRSNTRAGKPMICPITDIEKIRTFKNIAQF